MKASELKVKIKEGALAAYSDIYADLGAQSERYMRMLDGFTELYGDCEAELLSVPGRSEISGNHTDHNRGCVLAGAIDRDVIAAATKTDCGAVKFFSEGYPMSEVDLSDVSSPENFEKYTSTALIAGMIDGFMKRGYAVGGMNVYSTSEVLKGSGISSSAAYEVMIGNALNHLYNGGAVPNEEIAKIAQYAENVYFGKPCGLMDQMACAVGGFVYIDFMDKDNPEVVPIDFSLSDKGYALCIVNTGGNHADLNEDYASVPREMKDVARVLGSDVLRGIDEAQLIKNIPALRESVGDRAVLRALHFVRENERVLQAKDALKRASVEDFFVNVLASGRSSFQYLQNVYTTQNPKEQGLSLALAITDGFLAGKSSAFRVHGGGFAGTIQAFIKNEYLDEYCALMDSVFGKGAAMKLRIRPVGATKLF